MLIISISVVSRVKNEIFLLRFQLIYMISVSESQPSAVLIHVLNKEMFNALEGVLGTGDRQQAAVLDKPKDAGYLRHHVVHRVNFCKIVAFVDCYF